MSDVVSDTGRDQQGCRLGPTRPRSGRVGPAEAVEFVKHVHGVNATAPQRPSGADTAPQGPTGLKVIASRNRLICNV